MRADTIPVSLIHSIMTLQFWVNCRGRAYLSMAGNSCWFMERNTHSRIALDFHKRNSDIDRDSGEFKSHVRGFAYPTIGVAFFFEFARKAVDWP
jgi:hypothetical protein